jgi:hypothetical protein
MLLAAGLVVRWWRQRPPDAAEIERRRRSYLNQVGRIVEGEILEIREAPPEQAAPARRGSRSREKESERTRCAASGNGVRHLVLYSYSISGVTYATAQDITGMEERACLQRLVTGLPVSVKYDPGNPGNSILIADDWSGVH